MKKILIIVVILVLIAIILLFLSGQRKASVTNYQLSVTNRPTINQEVINQLVVQPEELTAEEKLTLLKNELVLKARNFAERYGSYSTDAQFANLRELKNEMSDRFWQATENYISQKEKDKITEFYGISTKVLNIQEKEFSTDQVVYLISTQRQETKGTTPKVFYQDLELRMIKENGGWKIDQIVWK